MKTKASKVVWNQAEQTAVKEGLKQLLQATRLPRHSWAHLLWVAQRAVLPSGRWRNERSLAPGIFRDSKTNELHWGSPRDIVFEALRDLQVLPAEQLRREPLPAREAVRLPPALKPEKAPAGTVSPAPKPIPSDPVPEAERANQRLKELEKQYAEALTKLRQLEEERAESRLVARLDQLEAAVGQITEFITSHGYRPTSDFVAVNRVALARSFAA
jgi:hypothetical protein